MGMRDGLNLHQQLALFGQDEVKRQAVNEGATRADLRLIDGAAAVRETPSQRDIDFYHAAFCQTTLPYGRPARNDQPWVHRNGRLRLVCTPGWSSARDGNPVPLGVPYGTKARLILIYLQAEGVKSRVIPVGESMTAWIKMLGLPVTGGKRGTISAVKEQVLRVANAHFKIEWDQIDEMGAIHEHQKPAPLVDGFSTWASRPGEVAWPREIELTERFHEHLQKHAVPLDRRALANLAETALGLDVYTFLAHRLPKLSSTTVLSWQQLMHQFGGGYTRPADFAKKLRPVLRRVQALYPAARVEERKGGLALKPSYPPIRQRTSIRLPVEPAD